MKLHKKPPHKGGIERLITPSLLVTLARDAVMNFPYGSQLLYEVLKDLHIDTAPYRTVDMI